MQSLFMQIIQATWQASVLAVLVFAVQLILGQRLSSPWRCGLWMLVFARLMMPALPASRVSLFNLLSRSDSLPAPANHVTVWYNEAPQQQSPEQAVSLATPTTQSPTHHFTFNEMLMAGWVCGFAFLLARMIFTAIQFSRRLSREIFCQDSHLIDMLDRCCKKAGVKNPPRLIETNLLNVPALYGVFRPVILLPQDLVGKLSNRQMQFVLLHELSHLKRRDLLSGWLVWLLNAVHWFNPLLWFAASRLRAERELACDNRVLRLTDPNDRLDYGQTIVKLLENLSAPTRLAGALAMVENHSSLKQRMKNIAGAIHLSQMWSVVAAVMMLALVAITFTQAQVAGTNPSSMATNVYDVRDLIVNMPDWEPPSTTQPATQKEGFTRQEMADRLIHQIEDQVQPTSWQDHGGQGTIRFTVDQKQLIVTQSPICIAELTNYIHALQDKRNTQVTLECRIIQGNVEPPSDPTGKWIAVDGIERWSVAFSDVQVGLLLKRLQQDSKTSTISAPRMTLFDGQRAFVEVANETSYIADIHAAIGSSGEETYQQDLKKMTDGVTIDCRTTIRPDKTSIKLDFKPELIKLLKMDNQRWPKSPAGRDDLYIQVPQISKAAANTVLIVPTGQVTLLRLTPKIDPPDAAAPPQQPLLLLVKATIVQPKPKT